MAQETQVYVASEFANLRSVVLSQCELRSPDVAPPAETTAFLPDHVRNEIDQMVGQEYGAVFPDRQLAWEAERAALAEVLSRYDVDIERPRLLNDAEKAQAGSAGYSNFFIRDPFFTIGSFLIEANLRFTHRRSEVLPARDLLVNRANASNCTYVALPQPAAVKNQGPFLEGGDVVVLGKQVFVGNSGLASNPEGARWLSNLIAPAGYTVELVNLRPDILHLDCALSLVREGLMVVCEDAFLDGIPPVLNSWDRVQIDLPDVELLAANGLPINSNVYITDPIFQSIGNQLSARGINVEYVDFSITRSLGGSFRCSTQAFWRED